MNTAATLYQILVVYAAIGAALGLAFILVGIESTDRASVGAYAFRPLLLPGLMILWPLVAARWIAARRKAH